MSVDKVEFVLDGDGIRFRLKERGLTQEGLASLIGVTPASISNKLNGNRTCTLTDACLIADVLDCRIDAIIKEV